MLQLVPLDLDLPMFVFICRLFENETACSGILITAHQQVLFIGVKRVGCWMNLLSASFLCSSFDTSEGFLVFIGD